MRKIILLLVFWLLSVAAYSQLEVKAGSFKEVLGFVNINTDIYDDDNGVLYAVIKVNTVNINDKQRRQLSFQGNESTFIEIEYKVGEVWVYLSSKPATYLKISHPDFGSTEFWFPFDLEPKKGYEMVLVNKSSSEPSGYGSLTVTTKPESGATILLNGKASNVKTPYTNDMMAAGQYEITVSKERYKSVTQTISIVDGEKLTVDIEMPAIYNKVKILSEPSGAFVYINDKKIGSTPLETDEMIIGSYEMKIAKEGWRTLRKTIDLKEGSVLELNETLEDYPEGVIREWFSVSPTEKVYFSKGNLQYNISTNTWRFAENQMDAIGLSNKTATQSNSGWIDLFKWGTENKPILTKYTYEASKNVFYEWGDNAISNGGNKPNTWRTLTKDEWEYLLYKRETVSGIRFVGARVGGVPCLILLPDSWNEKNYKIKKVNDNSASFEKNRISKSDWENYFEVNGAVFLPATGKCTFQHNRIIEMDDYYGGYYWTSTHYQDNKDAAYMLCFGGIRRADCTLGYSVRLVCSPE